MACFVQREREEVGAVGPRIEVGERIDLLRRRAVDRAIWVDAESAGIRRLQHPGDGHPVINHEKERQVGPRRRSLLEQELQKITNDDASVVERSDMTSPPG